MQNIPVAITSYSSECARFGAKLVAISKTHPTAVVMEAYTAGQRDFGENKVQELVQKHEECPKDIRWHMVGHLQRNKVKLIASFVHLIHSIDSLKLLQEVNKEGGKADRIIDVLLQVYIADEETKFGFSPSEVTQLLASTELQELESIRVVGLMGLATNTPDVEKVKAEFRSLKNLFDRLKINKLKNIDLSHLSMGMSGDYHLALEEGSNMIRIGSSIFGVRKYA